MTTDEKIDLLVAKVSTIDLILSEMQIMKQDISALKQSNLQTQVTLENTVNKCIQVMGEGFELNAERLDRFNVETIKNQSDLSYMIAKATSEKVDKLIERLKKSA